MQTHTHTHNRDDIVVYVAENNVRRWDGKFNECQREVRVTDKERLTDQGRERKRDKET